MTELVFRNVSIQRDNKKVLLNISLKLQKGELAVLIGPNGAGKSTLLKAALGLITPSAGSVTLNGQSIEQLTASERARHLAYLPQIRPVAWPIRVRDVIALGRYAYGVSPGKITEKDHAVISRVMEECHVMHLADRQTDQLSGGELARVHCARALSTKAPLLLADEPVASLDPRHQFQIMSLIRKSVDGGAGALVVMHDISLAARYADRLIWLQDGEVCADGSPAETLTDQRLSEVFDVSAEVNSDDIGHTVTITGPA